MSDEFLRDRQLESELHLQDDQVSDRFPSRDNLAPDEVEESSQVTKKRISGDIIYVGRLAIYKDGRYYDNKTYDDITDMLEDIAKKAREFREAADR